MTNPTGPRPGDAVLGGKGVVTHPPLLPDLPHSSRVRIRISVGTQEELDALIKFQAEFMAFKGFVLSNRSKSYKLGVAGDLTCVLTFKRPKGQISLFQ